MSLHMQDLETGLLRAGLLNMLDDLRYCDRSEREWKSASLCAKFYLAKLGGLGAVW